MFKDFREFAFKGNVLDLAVGVIIGGAFGTIVKSLVEDVITPLISPIFGMLDLTNHFIALNGKNYPSLKAAKDAGVAVIGYGSFLNALIQFLILAAVVYYCIVKPANRLRLAGAEVKTDYAVQNSEQNEKIIVLLEKMTNTPHAATPDVAPMK